MELVDLKDRSDLEYLRDPAFMSLPVEVFGNATRGSILATVFEIAPIPVEDLFFAQQINSFLGIDPGSTSVELKNLIRKGYLSINTTIPTKGNRILYARTTSPRWDIVEAVVRVARIESGYLST